MDLLPPPNTTKRAPLLTTTRLTALLLLVFGVLGLWSWMHHDLEKDLDLKHAQDPHSPSHGEVVRDHAALHKLADGSCLQLTGIKDSLDLKLGKCLAQRKLKGWKEFKQVEVVEVSDADELSSKVDKYRAEGVAAFPIQMEADLKGGLITVVGCKGKKKTYLGTLDDLFEILPELDSGRVKAVAITREELWQQCK